MEPHLGITSSRKPALTSPMGGCSMEFSRFLLPIEASRQQWIRALAHTLLHLSPSSSSHGHVTSL